MFIRKNTSLSKFVGGSYRVNCCFGGNFVGKFSNSSLINEIKTTQIGVV